MTAELLLERAQKAGALIATAESCTGGLVAGEITRVPGSSEIFERGFVTYSNAAKTELLGVPAQLIAEHGAVSEEVAHAMALGALANSDATLAVSITGIAGPGGSDHKPEGMVCFGLAKGSGSARAHTRLWGSIGRDHVRSQSVTHAIELLISEL